MDLHLDWIFIVHCFVAIVGLLFFMGLCLCCKKADDGALVQPNVVQGLLVIPGGQNNAPPEGNVDGTEETKIAVQGGGTKTGKVKLLGEATIAAAANDEEAIKARKSLKKDHSSQEFDGKRKEYVYEFINKEGGYLLDPAKKGAVIKIQPGQL